MADDKNKSNQPPRQSSQDPVEGRRDVPRSDSHKQRKYDVDKVPEKDYSSDDPTEGRESVTQGNRR